MVEINTLLTQAKLILEKAKVAQQESRLRGEQFNIFHACGVNHYEATHSAIIAEFLNPQGSHGQGDVYLKEFLDIVGKNGTLPVFDTSTASVFTEYVVPNGRLDILITNTKNQAIIIENKIYAGDQREQLKRYEEFAAEKYHAGNYAILYLTLWGDEASEQSGKDVKYTCISYKETIQKWLERCIQISAQKPLIRETMIQYTNLIKELTNQAMEQKYKNELLELMMNNAEATATICDMQDDFFKYVCENRIRPALKNLAEEMGFEYGESDDAWGNCKWQGFNFKRLPLAIYFEAERGKMYDIVYGFVFEGIKKKDCPAVRKTEAFPGKSSSGWPYGWAFLDKYRYWDMQTLADIVNHTDKFVNYIKEKIQIVLDELEQQGIKLE